MTHYLDRAFCHPKNGQYFRVNKTDYVLEGSLGDGAVGLVRKASRLKDSEPVAVKFLAPDPKYIDEAVFDDVSARFRREGLRGAKLEHNHLIEIYSYCENEEGSAFKGAEPQNPFLLMERIQGKTLESYIRNRPVEERGVFAIDRQNLHIAIQISHALEVLHKAKLIHRDIKPANIFLSEERGSSIYPLVKLGDFGVMKWGDFHSSFSTGTLTVTSQKGLGTLKYMSPEQAITPKTVTVRSDIYSLGISLFELFSSQILMSPHHVYEIMNARLSGGTVQSKFHAMGYELQAVDEDIASLLLDMHLRGAQGRPPITKIRGNLEYEYESRYGEEWDTDLTR